MTDATDRANSQAELAQLQEDIEAARRVLSRLLQQTVTARMTDPRVDDSRVVRVDELPLRTAKLGQGGPAGKASGQAERPTQPAVRTGLMPRQSWLEQIAPCLALARRHKRVFALLDVELEHFAQMQSGMRPEAAELLLRELADRIRVQVRDCDLTLSQGNGQFLVALMEITKPDDAAVTARRIQTALGCRIQAGRRELRFSVSIGIGVFPENGQRMEDLLDAAARSKLEARAPEGRAPRAEHDFGDGAAADLPLERQAVGQGWRAEPHTRVSAEQAAEDAWLRDANERLVMAVLDARELSDALLQAQQRHVDLLAVIAEELRDPQAPVRVAASLLGSTQVDQALLSHVQSMLDEQMLRMQRMLERLDGVVGARLDPLTLARERIDLRDAVHDAVRSTQQAVRARGQNLALQLGEQPLDVMGDRERLIQVVANLLDNASKYSGEGATITVGGSTVHDSVVVEVRDNGIGMSAGAISRIFAPFWHDAEALAVDGAGIGLGLTVVHRLVEALGGTVQAFSAGRGLGSRFVVTLPGAPV